MAQIELNPDESNFLYRVLDQVSVSGPQAKALLLSIMVKLVGAQKPMPEPPKDEGKSE